MNIAVPRNTIDIFNSTDKQLIKIWPLTSREERLAKAEAPSEASLLLASRRERLPGGRR